MSARRRSQVSSSLNHSQFHGTRTSYQEAIGSVAVFSSTHQQPESARETLCHSTENNLLDNVVSTPCISTAASSCSVLSRKSDGMILRSISRLRQVIYHTSPQSSTKKCMDVSNNAQNRYFSDEDTAISVRESTSREYSDECRCDRNTSAKSRRQSTSRIHHSSQHSSRSSSHDYKRQDQQPYCRQTGTTSSVTVRIGNALGASRSSDGRTYHVPHIYGLDSDGHQAAEDVATGATKHQHHREHAKSDEHSATNEKQPSHNSSRHSSSSGHSNLSSDQVRNTAQANKPSGDTASDNWQSFKEHVTTLGWIAAVVGAVGVWYLVICPGDISPIDTASTGFSWWLPFIAPRTEPTEQAPAAESPPPPAPEGGLTDTQGPSESKGCEPRPEALEQLEKCLSDKKTLLMEATKAHKKHMEIEEKVSTIRESTEKLQAQTKETVEDLKKIHEDAASMKDVCQNSKHQIKELEGKLNQLSTSLDQVSSKTAGCCHTEANLRQLVVDNVNQVLLDKKTEEENMPKPSVISTATDAHILAIVDGALAKYSADMTGLADYALESAGGRIINSRCSPTFHHRSTLISMFGIPLWYDSHSPRKAIQPGNLPGQCWAFPGSQGRLAVELAAPINVTGVSLEHIPKALAPTGSILSAPKEFSILGLANENDLEGLPLGTFIYRDDGKPIQYFPMKAADSAAFCMIQLNILSNYGNKEYTCVYRFRVHGVPVKPNESQDGHSQ